MDQPRPGTEPTRRAGWSSGLRRMLVIIPLLAIAVGALALLAPRTTGSVASSPTSGTSRSSEVSGATTPSSGRAGGDSPTTTGKPIEVTGETPPPVRVQIPRVGVDSSLDALRMTASGELEAPPRWQVAGWYSAGFRPGEAGPVVIAGHVDSPTGPAVFAELPDVRVGDEVAVTQRGGHVLRYRVYRVEVAAKDAFPTRSVYNPTSDSELRMITCHGPYVQASGGYQDNLIVYANQTS